MGNIAALRHEVSRCERLLAMPIALGALGRLLTWRSRSHARRALEKAKALLGLVEDIETRTYDALDLMALIGAAKALREDEDRGA